MVKLAPTSVIAKVYRAEAVWLMRYTGSPGRIEYWSPYKRTRGEGPIVAFCSATEPPLSRILIDDERPVDKNRAAGYAGVSGGRCKPMSPGFEFIVRALIIGVSATAVLDLWSILLKRLFGIPSSDWSMVGRWFGHFPQGQFVHDSIRAASPVRGETLIGWTAHYAIGIFYSFLLLAISGLDWARQPTLLPALILALVALAAPFFIMQPGMGAGIAASRTPNPAQARLRSLLNHSVFGVGLYASAVLATVLLPPAVA